MRYMLLLCLSVALLNGSSISAQVNLSSAEWHTMVTSGYATKAVAIEQLGVIDCDGIIVNTIGAGVYMRRASNGVPTAPAFLTGGHIERPPTIAKLQDGKWYAFVASGDGWLYKLNIPENTLAVNSGHQQKVDLRRPGCVQDKLRASPVVQLKGTSNSGYNLAEDIVIVGTDHACGSQTSNRIYALNASDITLNPIWIFNLSGGSLADFFTALYLDTPRNVIYATSNQPGSSPDQETFRSLSTNTGGILWSKDFGSIHSSPVLGNPGKGGLDHLYLVNKSSVLYALNPNNGVEDWNLQLSAPPFTTTKDLSIGEGAFGRYIIATTEEPTVRAVFDGGLAQNSGQELWTYFSEPGVNVVTIGCIASEIGKVYVGEDIAAFQQLNLLSGQVESTAYINVTSEPIPYNISDPTVYKSGPLLKAIVSSDEGRIAQFHIPGFILNSNMNIWRATSNSAWENPANWSKNSVPNANTDVIIKCGTAPVIVNSNAVCKRLYVANNASITVNPAFTLTVQQ